MKSYSYRKVSTLVCLIVFLTSACQPVSEKASEHEVNSNNINLLTTQRWQLVKLNSPDIELPKQQIPFIIFIAGDDKVEGFAGCNNFFGSYSQDKQALTLSALGMTRRYCADTAALEAEYENMLGKVTNFKIAEHRLLLLADEDVLATFEATE
jgi:heat shock protein HslJ